MEERIKEYINNPERLEELYREDSKSFEKSFENIYPGITKTELVSYWKIRLDYDKIPEKIKTTDLTDILVVIIACLIAGFLIKIPDLFKIKEEEFIFYEKNAGLIVFLGLAIYVIWVNKILEIKRLILIASAFIVPAIYINLLPSPKGSDSIFLACMHLPLLLWYIYGMVFIDFNLEDHSQRIDYIKYNGDLAILSALIIIAGGILTAITISLFSAIGMNIEKFYMDNIAIIGVVCVPVVATYVIKNYATMTNKIAPVIAGIFSPLVLISAIIYLLVLATSGRDPYKDREFLMVFNVMLLGVMAVIVFSISETSAAHKQKFNEMVLLILSVITVIIDLIALSAIFYRLGAFGITPNRLAVLGSNLLILGNLVLIIIDLYRINFKQRLIDEVEMTIAKYLPVYAIWILFVIFGFPLIFGMK